MRRRDSAPAAGLPIHGATRLSGSLPQLRQGRRLTIHGAPEGHDGFVLGRLAAGGAHEILHVCHDDGRMARLASAIGFFRPDLDILTFPAWDCLPYDRASPNAEIVSRRVDTLTRLADAETGH